MTFCVLMPMIWPNVPDLPQFHRYTKSGINWLSDGLYIWIRLNLLWNMEFNTLNDMPMIWGFWFQYPWFAPMPQNLSKVSFKIKSWVKHFQWVSMYDSLTLVWGIWIQSPQITSMPQILYNRLPWNLSKVSFDWNIKLKTLDYLYVPFPTTLNIWIQIFEIALMSQILSSVYNFSLELPLGLSKTWANLSRYVSWRMRITFFVSLTMIDLGHWVHNYSESQKIFTFLLAFSRWLICQTLMKVWRFQKFNLYFCIHLQLYLCIK